MERVKLFDSQCNMAFHTIMEDITSQHRINAHISIGIMDSFTKAVGILKQSAKMALLNSIQLIVLLG
jgi:hypothetical protein